MMNTWKAHYCLFVFKHLFNVGTDIAVNHTLKQLRVVYGIYFPLVSKVVFMLTLASSSVFLQHFPRKHLSPPRELSYLCSLYPVMYQGIMLRQNLTFTPLSRFQFSGATQPSSSSSSSSSSLRALECCVSHIRRTEQLFVSFGGVSAGQPLSKQSLTHWLSEAMAWGR